MTEMEPMKKEMKKLHIIIEESCCGMTLEQYLRQKLKFTKAQIKSMKFRPEGLMVNGVRRRISHILQTGEALTVQFEEEMRSSSHLVPTEGALEILYEDDDLIAVWKESGQVLHPAHGHYEDTLSNRLHAYFQKKGEQVTIRSIGRLDRDTSGIVVFAKNQVAAARLWQQKEEGLFWKEYLAVCQGRLMMEEQSPWHTICAPIGKAPGELMKMCVTPEGLPAVTHYQILRHMEDQTLIRVRIETGRTHQIRVHMASMGHALVGDVLYNERIRQDSRKAQTEEKKERGLQLSAWRAELLQPFCGSVIRLEAPKRFELEAVGVNHGFYGSGDPEKQEMELDTCGVGTVV